MRLSYDGIRTDARPAPPGVDARTVLRSFAEACAAADRLLAAHLWVEDPSVAALRLIAAAGPLPPPAGPLPFDAPLARAAVEGVASLEELPDAGSGGATPAWRYGIPVSVGERRAVACVDLRSPARPDGLALARASAAHRGLLCGAVALHIAHAEVRVAGQLIEAARDLDRALDPDSVLATALDRAVALCDAATASVMLFDPDTRRLGIVRSVGLTGDVVRQASLAAGEGIAGWVFASGQPLLIEDLAGRSVAGRRHGVRSSICVPLADGKDALGVLSVGSRAYPSRLTDAHLRAMGSLGKRTAAALRKARAAERTRDLSFETLRALCMVLEATGSAVRGTTERVTTLCGELADTLRLSEEDREALRVAALVHDVGMARVGDGAFSEDRPLTTVERALVRLHPRAAAEVLRDIPALERVAPIVYHHHERFDGTGYLDGTAGERIPLGSRVLAVADAYVAMTSPRPYRSAMSAEQAFAQVRQNAGTQFDPAVVEALSTVLSGGSDRVPEDASSERGSDARDISRA